MTVKKARRCKRALERLIRDIARYEKSNNADKLEKAVACRDALLRKGISVGRAA